VVTVVRWKVLPMDIYPMELIKAYVWRCGKMENLVYEVAPEDFALIDT
jgi:hypothetical protein